MMAPTEVLLRSPPRHVRLNAAADPRNAARLPLPADRRSDGATGHDVRAASVRDPFKTPRRATRSSFPSAVLVLEQRQQQQQRLRQKEARGGARAPAADIRFSAGESPAATGAGHPRNRHVTPASTLIATSHGCRSGKPVVAPARTQPQQDPRDQMLLDQPSASQMRLQPPLRITIPPRALSLLRAAAAPGVGLRVRTTARSVRTGGAASSASDAESNGEPGSAARSGWPARPSTALDAGTAAAAAAAGSDAGAAQEPGIHMRGRLLLGGHTPAPQRRCKGILTHVDSPNSEAAAGASDSASCMSASPDLGEEDLCAVMLELSSPPKLRRLHFGSERLSPTRPHFGEAASSAGSGVGEPAGRLTVAERCARQHAAAAAAATTAVAAERPIFCVGPGPFGRHHDRGGARHDDATVVRARSPAPSRKRKRAASEAESWGQLLADATSFEGKSCAFVATVREKLIPKVSRRCAR
jgi:hypothetical protein